MEVIFFLGGGVDSNFDPCKISDVQSIFLAALELHDPLTKLLNSKRKSNYETVSMHCLKKMIYLFNSLKI